MPRKKRVSKVWDDMLTRKDAIRLCKWWNGHSTATYQEYEIRRSPSNPKFWAVYRV
jgi:hypothetical protein